MAGSSSDWEGPCATAVACAVSMFSISWFSAVLAHQYPVKSFTQSRSRTYRSLELDANSYRKVEQKFFRLDGILSYTS